MHVFLCIAAAAVAREQQGELGRLTDLRGREWLGSFRTPLAYYSRLTYFYWLYLQGTRPVSVYGDYTSLLTDMAIRCKVVL